MDLRQLRYFVALATQQNDGKAAGVLHVTQPALSRQIRLLGSCNERSSAWRMAHPC